MSIEIMSEVWQDRTLSPNERLVLLDIANHADQDRFCWPGLTRLSERSGITKRSVSRIVRRLEEAGYLAVDRTHESKRSNTYRITPMSAWPTDEPEEIDLSRDDTVSPPKAERGVTSNHQEGIVVNPQGGIAVSPESSFNHHELPSSSASTLTRAAPAPASPKEPSTRSEQNAIRKAVSEHFQEVTHLKIPSTTAKALGRLWWSPIREICVMSEWDVNRAKQLISSAVIKLEGMTVSDPNSILKTCRALAAVGVSQAGRVPQW